MMKKVILISSVLFFSFASLAQRDSTMSGEKEKRINTQPMEMAKTNGVIMKNGTMMTVKNGKMTNMNSDLVCNNGTRITSAGKVTQKNGSQTMLKEGEYMDACGKVLPIQNSKTNHDKNMYLVPDSTKKIK